MVDRPKVKITPMDSITSPGSLRRVLATRSLVDIGDYPQGKPSGVTMPEIVRTTGVYERRFKKWIREGVFPEKVTWDCWNLEEVRAFLEEVGRGQDFHPYSE